MSKAHTQQLSVLLILSLVLTVFGFSGLDAHAASGSRTKYIAHRGWSSRAPENTEAAFTLAAQNSRFYGVEFDIWEASYPDKKETVVDEAGNTQTVTITQEPLLLVMHDSTTQRMCGKNASIRSINRDNLGKYTIRSGKNVSKYSGQKIPTAEQALDSIYSNSAGAVPVIELKHRLSSRALGYLLKSLNGRKAVVISFEFKAVSDVEKMARSMGISGNIQTMYLRKSLSRKKYSSTIRKLKNAGIDCISLKYTAISKRTVKKFHKAGLQVCAWTLPNKKTARRYARMGVDYITANGKVW